MTVLLTLTLTLTEGGRVHPTTVEYRDIHGVHCRGEQLIDLNSEIQSADGRLRSCVRADVPPHRHWPQAKE